MLQIVLSGLVVRGIGVALAYVSLTLLTRLLSPEDFGRYSIFVALVMFASTPLHTGLRLFLTRELRLLDAAAKRNEALVQWGNRFVLGVAFLTFVFGGLLHLMLNNLSLSVLLLGSVSVGAIGTMAVQIAMLYNARHALRGQVIEACARNLFLVAGAGLLIVVGAEPFAAATTFDFTHLAVAFTLATIAAAVVALTVRRKAISLVSHSNQPKTEKLGWTFSVAMIGLATGVQIFSTQVDLVMLGWLRPIEEAGFYRLAAQISALVSLPLVALNAFIEPRLSEANRNDDPNQAKQLIRSAMGMMGVLALSIALPIYLSREIFVSLLFGPLYMGALEPLPLLIINACALCFFAPVMTMSLMAHRENDLLVASLVVLALNVALNFVLVPRFGMTGAASATLVSTLILRVLISYRIGRLLSTSADTL